MCARLRFHNVQPICVMCATFTTPASACLVDLARPNFQAHPGPPVHYLQPWLRGAALCGFFLLLRGVGGGGAAVLMDVYQKTRDFRELLQIDHETVLIGEAATVRAINGLVAIYGPEPAALKTELADCFITVQSVEYTYVLLSIKDNCQRHLLMKQLL